jgi:hypothetical protein
MLRLDWLVVLARFCDDGFTVTVLWPLLSVFTHLPVFTIGATVTVVFLSSRSNDLVVMIYRVR